MTNQVIQEQPLVSVVMCTYNGLPYIKEAVECILNQTYRNWELIISDDKSTDGTDHWLKQTYGDHPQIKLFFQEKNLGYLANKNFVHRQARGIFITQLDSDDVCSPHRLEKQIDVFNQTDGIKIVGCGFSRIDMNGKFLNQISSKVDMLIDSNHDNEYPFWFPSLMIHYSVFQDIGYFDEYFSGAFGDDFYWTKKANKSYVIYCLHDVLYSYRDNPSSITNQLTNIRKMILPEIVRILIEQMRTGDDWLSMGDHESLKKLEVSLLNNARFMGRQYRIWAAKAIDKNNKSLAIDLLRKSFVRNPLSVMLYRTSFYALRKFSRL